MIQRRAIICMIQAQPYCTATQRREEVTCEREETVRSGTTDWIHHDFMNKWTRNISFGVVGCVVLLTPIHT